MRLATALLPGKAPPGAEQVALAAIRSVWRAGPHFPLASELGTGSWEGLWSRSEGCHPALDDLAAWAPSYRTGAWRAALQRSQRSAPGAPGPTWSPCWPMPPRPPSGAPARSSRGCERAGVGGLPLPGRSPDERPCRRPTPQASGELAGGLVRRRRDPGEAAAGKPSPAAFQLVLDRLGVAPSDAVLVGESWERDVRGALRAGLRAIWIPVGRPVTPHEHPTARGGAPPGRGAELDRAVREQTTRVGLWIDNADQDPVETVEETVRRHDEAIVAA